MSGDDRDLIEAEIRAKAVLDDRNADAIAAHREWAAARRALLERVEARGYAYSLEHGLFLTRRLFGGIRRTHCPRGR